MARKTVEVDEEEYLRTQKLRETVLQAANHPKAKLLLQQAHKLVDPNAHTPDLDREQADNDRVAAVKKEFDEYREAQEKEKAEQKKQADLDALTAKVEGSLAKLKREQRLTDEGVAAVRKVMDEEGILNAEAAYAIFEKRHPPAMPATPRGAGAWNFLEVPTESEEGAYTKSLLETKGSNDLVLDREIRAALNDIRGAR
jgi:hypothetical protein